MEGQATRRLASETSTPRVRPVIIRLILPVIPPRAEVAPIERVLVECVRAERGSACHAANGSTLMCHPSVRKAATRAASEWPAPIWVIMQIGSRRRSRGRQLEQRDFRSHGQIGG